MSDDGIQILILILVIVLPIAWFASEFQNKRGLRIGLGLAAFFVCFSVAFGVAIFLGHLEQFNANAWYGSASKNLIDVTIAELEADNKDRVLGELKMLQEKFQPTYENRARYDKLIEEFIRNLGHEPKNSV